MIKDILKYFATRIVATMFYITPVQADNICIAGNFDGNVKRAKQVIQTCENNGGDAIVLMGDYSVRGIPGKRNFRTDFDSTNKVLSEFGKSKLPVYVLSGSNDKMSDVEQIASENKNMTFLEDNKSFKIADLNVIPLNGYNNPEFMFEGAEFIDKNDFNQYLTTLSQNPNATSVSHISPYGHIDQVRIPRNISNSGMQVLIMNKDKYTSEQLDNLLYLKKHVGDRKLENTLNSLNMDSISAAIRESPGAGVINKGRWKSNPGELVLMLGTDGNGNIEEFNFYK